MLPASRQKPPKAPKETMNVIWLSLVLKLKRVTRSVPRTIISMPNIFSDRCAQPELPNLTDTVEVIKDTDFLKSYSRAAAREKREDAFRDESASPSWIFSPRRARPAFPSKPVQ